MATYTDNYNLIKPSYSEIADVATINTNMNTIDDIMHSTQISIATAYDASTTSANPYNTGDIVMYEKIAYKCKYDGVYGTWDASKWEQTTLADNLGGGDASEISYDNTTSGLTADDVQEAIDELEGNIEDVSDGLDDAVESLAPAYDSTQTYDEGDIVSYQNKLYECNTDQTTGAWDAQYWDEYVVSEHMGEGGSTVTITPETIAEPKQKIADFEIDGASGSLYAPIVEIEGHASGAIATFTDGGNNKPLKSLKVAINPVQASGTPTPQAPIPIYGWTGANVTRCRKNLCTIFTDGKVPSISTGRLVTAGGARSDFVKVLPSTNYIFSVESPAQQLYIFDYDINKNFIGYNPDTGLNVTHITPSNCYYCMIRTSSNANVIEKPQFELGTTATAYEPYNGATYPITWSEEGTVYGGELDVTSGVLKITHANIASYNGEPINEPWLSSMDVYQSGATPTTGAQVVYPLTTPTEITLTPTQITTLLGNNNIWSDTGDILEYVYQRDLNIVINQFDARITALEQALSGTRRLSLSKPAVKEEETKEESKEEPKEEEETKEEQR